VCAGGGVAAFVALLPHAAAPRRDGEKRCVLRRIHMVLPLIVVVSCGLTSVLNGDTVAAMATATKLERVAATKKINRARRRRRSTPGRAGNFEFESFCRDLLDEAVLGAPRLLQKRRRDRDRAAILIAVKRKGRAFGKRTCASP